MRSEVCVQSSESGRPEEQHGWSPNIWGKVLICRASNWTDFRVVLVVLREVLFMMLLGSWMVWCCGILGVACRAECSGSGSSSSSGSSSRKGTELSPNADAMEMPMPMPMLTWSLMVMVGAIAQELVDSVPCGAILIYKRIGVMRWCTGRNVWYSI